MRKVARRILIVVIAIAVGALIYFTRSDDRVIARELGADGGKLTLLSRSYTIDRLYQSMQGPSSQHEGVRLIEEPGRQLLWITGINCQLVGPDGTAQRPQEFFCHSNLAYTPQSIGDEHETVGRTRSPEGRLFTLIPGRLDLTLHAGFGMPVDSDEALD